MMAKDETGPLFMYLFFFLLIFMYYLLNKYLYQNL